MVCSSILLLWVKLTTHKCKRGKPGPSKLKSTWMAMCISLCILTFASVRIHLWLRAEALQLTNWLVSVTFAKLLFFHFSKLYHCTARSHSRVNKIGAHKSMGKLAACLKLQDEVVLHYNLELKVLAKKKPQRNFKT